MLYRYTETEIKISPFSDVPHFFIIVHKPIMLEGKRQHARVSWSRFVRQYPIAAYEFSQALFVAAGLADVLNLVPDMREVRQFGITEEI